MDSEHKKESHFTILGILTETGVLGLLAVGLIMMMFLMKMHENAALEPDRESGWIQINEGLMMAIIGILVAGLTHDIQTNRTMWLVLALIVAFRPAFLSTMAAEQPAVEEHSASLKKQPNSRELGRN